MVCYLKAELNSIHTELKENNFRQLISLVELIQQKIKQRNGIHRNVILTNTKIPSH